VAISATQATSFALRLGAPAASPGTSGAELADAELADAELVVVELVGAELVDAELVDVETVGASELSTVVTGLPFLVGMVLLSRVVTGRRQNGQSRKVDSRTDYDQ
jgi:hypothetical protein